MISRADISKRIHERLGGAISYRIIQQAVGVIIEQIARDLVSDQIVSARRFGTLSPHCRPGHLAHDLSTGEVRELPSTRSVKFHPHESFLSLLADREERFRGERQRKSDSEKKP
jgi:nucleoid DNA-binding protein